jgi:hypothetical protein
MLGPDSDRVRIVDPMPRQDFQNVRRGERDVPEESDRLLRASCAQERGKQGEMKVLTLGCNSLRHRFPKLRFTRRYSAQSRAAKVTILGHHMHQRPQTAIAHAPIVVSNPFFREAEKVDGEPRIFAGIPKTGGVSVPPDQAIYKPCNSSRCRKVVATPPTVGSIRVVPALRTIRNGARFDTTIKRP